MCGSSDCKRSYRAQRARERRARWTEDERKRERERQRERRSGRPRAYGHRKSRTCEVCGAAYVPTYSKQRTCGRACGLWLRHDAIGAKCDVPWQTCQCERPFIARCATRCPRCPAPSAYVPVRPTHRTCLECGEPFLGPNGLRRKYCNSACARKAHRRHRRHQDRVALRLVKGNTSNHGPRDCAKRADCAECGKGLVGKQLKWCSRTCHDRAYDRHDRHLARLAAPSDEPLFTIRDIAIRDGWRCHICQKRVKVEQATFDHLVPIMDGGLHEPANVALAHHRCNTLRGARGAAQLLLVA